MIKTYFLFIIGVCLLYGCETELSTQVKQIPNTIDLFQYNAGNSWVYEVTIHSEDSTVLPTISGTDTISVLGDTLIRKNIYKKIRMTELGGSSIHFYRDSVGCLVNSSGNIIFSMVNPGQIYNTTFEVLGQDTLYSYFDITSGALGHTFVPIGNFKTYPKLRFIRIDQSERITKSFYAPGIGLVSFEKIFLGAKRGNITWKLVDFRI